METVYLILTVGLPRSGKSTWAQKQGYPIVNPDSIRKALHGQAFYADAEPMVWAIAKLMVRSLILAGHSRIILDATNITRKRRDEWQDLPCQMRFKMFPESKDECIEIAKHSNRPDLIPVIERMAEQFDSLSSEECNWIWGET